MPQTTTSFNSSHDGQQLSVNSLIKAPAFVRARMLDILDQQFLADAILRTGPRAEGGSVVYEESTPLFANEDAATVAEFGEIPAVIGERGIPHAVATTKKALGLVISREMKDRDNRGAVDMQMLQIRNTMRRTWENVFLAAVLSNAGVHTMAASAAWSSGTSKIRYDLSQAIYLVENSDTDSTDNTGDNKLMYEPDTLIISRKTKADFMSSDDVAKVFLGGDIASENLQYTGKMPRRFFGLDVVTSWRLPVNTAIVLQRKVCGGISDERPLEVGPLKEQPDNTESWRSNVVRRSAVFLDQPKAVTLITGV